MRTTTQTKVRKLRREVKKKSLQGIIYDERKRLLVDNLAILVLLEVANSPFLEEGVPFARIQRLLASTLHIDAFLNLRKAQLASRFQGCHDNSAYYTLSRAVSFMINNPILAARVRVFEDLDALPHCGFAYRRSTSSSTAMAESRCATKGVIMRPAIGEHNRVIRVATNMHSSSPHYALARLLTLALHGYVSVHSNKA